MAHVTLRLGRLMLVNGADTAHAQEAVITLAGKLRYQARLLVFAEGLLLTLEDDDGFRTRLGPAISGMTVNMGTLAALDEIYRQDLSAVPDVALIDRQLNQIETRCHRYPR